MLFHVNLVRLVWLNIQYISEEKKMCKKKKFDKNIC